MSFAAYYMLRGRDSAVIVYGRHDLPSDGREFYLTSLKREALQCGYIRALGCLISPAIQISKNGLQLKLKLY